MRDAWRLAAGTFLAVPVHPPGRVDDRVAGRSMLLAPLTAVPLGLVWAAVGLLETTRRLDGLVGAVVALVVVALATRALHLDGLADSADGLASGHDAARSLEVMRRGDTGPAGVAALVLTLGLQAAALGTLLRSPVGTALAVGALVASRLAPAVAARRGVPAARPGGLGSTVAGTVAPGALAVVAGLVALGVALGAGVTARLGGDALVPGAAAGVVAVAAVVGSAWVVVRHARRRVGGITGDVIGAAVEISLAVGLAASSVAVTLV